MAQGKGNHAGLDIDLPVCNKNHVWQNIRFFYSFFVCQRLTRKNRMMKVAVIHYHAKPGGVTTAIRQQASATGNKADILLVTGEAPGRDPGMAAAVVPEIGYDRDGMPACPDPEAAADAILEAVKARWPGGCDLFHIHNPLLAKNRRFPAIIRALQKRGHRLLLHIHDFAEDGRPGAYFADEPYPEDCHFCVINSRDRDILVQAGADPKGVHLVPNMVTPLPCPATAPVDEKIALYPVRAIRRKNIGEAILISQYFKNGETLHITLGPNSPADLAAYEQWKAFVGENGMDVVFEASLKHKFENLVASSAFMVTTSITEGFGFSFLEPWTAGKMIHGRKLADICSDFENQGVRLDHMYDRLSVPVRWVGRELLSGRIKAAYEKSRKAFGLCENAPAVEKFMALAQKETIDFGMLDEHLQQKVLLRLAGGHERPRKVLAEMNPFLDSGFAKTPKEIIDVNNIIVRDRFGSRICAERLLAAYVKTASFPVSHRLDKAVIVEKFFTPENFSLLKWGDYGSRV